MKGFVSALGLLMSIATVGSAQESWGSKLFKENAHDFGSVPRGAQLNYKFKMTNIFAVPLEVNSRPGCTCVTVNPPSVIIQPKQEMYLDINMDATRFLGAKSVNIRIDVANGVNFMSSANLRVSAFARSDVVCNPGMVQFGLVDRGQSSTPQIIDVEYAGVLDWRVEELVKHSLPLDTTLKELYRRPGQVGYRLTVSIKPDAPIGMMKHELVLRTNDPASPTVPILVEANVRANLEVVPGTVNFGLMKVGEAKSLRVLVRGTKPFQILGIEGTGDGLSAKVPGNIAAVHFLQLDCLPAKAGDLKRQIKIKTDSDQSGVTVGVEGSAGP